MADIVPPVPNQDYQKPGVWWEWLRKVRTNINTFAADISALVAEIAAILTQITAVNQGAEVSLTSSTWSATSSHSTASTTIIDNFTTTGSSVLIVGSCAVSAISIIGASCVGVSISCSLYRDGTFLATFGSGFNPVVTFTNKWAGENFSIAWLDSPTAGTYDYKVVASITTFDNTGTPVNTDGELDFVCQMVAKELKT